MKSVVLALACAVIALPAAGAQNATVSGQIVVRDGGGPLAYATVALLSGGTQLLASDSGTFVLRNVKPGEVRLRFKRIGFVPTDTVLSVGAGKTAQVRVEMTRLVIQLPQMVVNGTCTNETPFETKPGIMADLFDQVNQNAERVRLLASEKPFRLQASRIRGQRIFDGTVVPTQVDTVFRGALPLTPYEPRRVIYRGEGHDAGRWIVKLPELPDFADTTFTNNHCFRYAGQTRFASDSVIAVEFEPVPWLDREVDLKGTMYLRTTGYQLVGLVVSLNRIPAQFRTLQDYTVRARFSELVTGVPVLVEWEMENRFRGSEPSFVETGRMLNIRWSDLSGMRPEVRPD